MDRQSWWRFSSRLLKSLSDENHWPSLTTRFTIACNHPVQRFLSNSWPTLHFFAFSQQLFLRSSWFRDGWKQKIPQNCSCNPSDSQNLAVFSNEQIGDRALKVIRKNLKNLTISASAYFNLSLRLEWPFWVCDSAKFKLRFLFKRLILVYSYRCKKKRLSYGYSGISASRVVFLFNLLGQGKFFVISHIIL